ncbi:hypothetical protein KM043_011063 [Ampulex compressa]|nr:hypothetical protein KM043_011063 [Ampulex compressa]
MTDDPDGDSSGENDNDFQKSYFCGAPGGFLFDGRNRRFSTGATEPSMVLGSVRVVSGRGMGSSRCVLLRDRATTLEPARGAFRTSGVAMVEEGGRGWRCRGTSRKFATDDGAFGLVDVVDGGDTRACLVGGDASWPKGRRFRSDSREARIGEIISRMEEVLGVW